jgi:signal transduction histidine kinase
MDATAFVGRPFQELWGRMRPLHAFPEDDERVLEALLADEAALRVDLLSLAHPAGRVLERFTSPLRDAAGHTIGRICTFRDVTARTRAEAEVRLEAEQERRAREELARLHDDLRLANEGLERRMSELGRHNKDLKVLDEMKSNLLANVSHELQTPLVSIKGFTEMILKGSLGPVSAEQERGLQVALRNINRLIGMIDHVLAFARRAGEIAPLRLSTFPLGPLVEEAFDLVRDKARDRKVSLRAVIPQGDLILKADRDKVLQVLLNLLSNAVRYNREGGEVVLEAERGRRGAARVEVRDTGIGMSREVLDRIFDRFFQAGRSGSQKEGTGIGLSIVRDILSQHGATMRVTSQEGKGSIFYFTLPLDRGGRPHRASLPDTAHAGARHAHHEES